MKKNLLILIISIVITIFGFLFLFFLIESGELGNLVTEIAITTNKPSLCKLVPIGYDGVTSDYKCYLKVMNANKNINACSYISDKDECYSEFAMDIVSKDKNLALDTCAKINDKKTRASCIDFVNKATINP